MNPQGRYAVRWRHLHADGSIKTTMTPWHSPRSPFMTLCGYKVPESAEVREDRGLVECETCLRILLHGGVS